MAMDEEWPIRCAVLCWLLWKRRCRLILDSEVDVLDDILVHGNRMVAECSRANCVMQRDRGGRALESKWIPPPVGWVKSNVDAAVSNGDHTVGIEGAVRDDNGSWLFGVANMLAKRGQNLHMDSMSFAMPQVDMVRIVEEESRDSPQTIASSQLVEIVTSFDPEGTGC
ncbi:hypothetical protein V6N11_055425 [Hibiscus sabdariffa]|uniref:Uncharacterized protein n=1 Tax=Hibiscus sabdariffa TaxID=183260 RepID=A0ABR2PF88_9ROSI